MLSRALLPNGPRLCHALPVRLPSRAGLCRMKGFVSYAAQQGSPQDPQALAKAIDMRSDTVTKPTAAMLAAMSSAEVGDMVFGDDPTVNLLEARMAEFFGKEAALFVPSGTQGNLIGIMAHCWSRGSEYICGDRSHIYIYEQGGAAQFGGNHPHVLPNLDDGTIPLDKIAKAVRADDPHYCVSTLVCIENTHNMCGGRVLPQDYIEEVAALAHGNGLKLHMDGARVWNAIEASGDADGTRMMKNVDSASICLSKGLGAPVGSVLVGDKELIARGVRLRKALGGGMRQAGVLAAAGLHALDKHFPEVFEADRRNAQRLGEYLAKFPGLTVDAKSIESNIVMVDLDTSALGMNAQALVAKVAERGTRCVSLSETRIRLCTNLHVDARHVNEAIAAFGEVLKAS
eukprot:TRINITY_DN21273_c0_g1_i1.p1 TRINITY_DN21273_c0_g1~~TRINITY_DN21273_c0_g1_i1.p1  ORF type:complete len:401 (+),score=57.39 TRINITY_DN21273_c0_g1_i1:83-1285(+)